MSDLHESSTHSRRLADSQGRPGRAERATHSPCIVRSLADIGERGLIARMRGAMPSRADVLVGAGDDCALVAWTDAEDLVLKSDPVREGHHFLPDADPRLVGRKALARVLSDFASMGAEPRWALADLVAPADAPLARIDGVFEGFAALAREHGVALVGGDTSCGEALELHVFCAGAVPHGRALLRSGARPGDLLFATGPLGDSFATGHHLAFEPRLAAGRRLREAGAHACIDVSDGLASELWHLARESGMHLHVDLSAIPLSPTLAGRADAVAHALGDGEDFELLFAAPAPVDPGPGARPWPPAFGRVAGPARGGAVTFSATPGGAARPLPERGFDHFLAN